MNFPRGLGLDILRDYLSDDQFEELIVKYRNVPRKQRRIILPSIWCLKKCYFHALWKKILSRKLKWKTVKKGFVASFGSLDLARAYKWDVQRCYHQRQKEIVRENHNV